MKKREEDQTNLKLVSLLILVISLVIFCIVYIYHESSVRNEERNQPLANPNVKGLIMLGVIKPEGIATATDNDKPILIENELVAQEAENGNVYGLFQDPFGRYFWSRVR